MKKILKMIILFIVFFINYGCSRRISQSDYEQYLKETYGEEQQFEYVSSQSCNWFELSSCTYEYTSAKLNGDVFAVTGFFNTKGKQFKDNYVQTLYTGNLKKEYSSYFLDWLPAKTYVRSVSIENAENLPLVKYPKYLELIANKNVEITFQTRILLDKENESFHLKVNDSSVELDDLDNAKIEVENFINNKYDIKAMRKKITSIVEENNLTNISSINIDFNDCLDDEYYVSCSQIINLYK